MALANRIRVTTATTGTGALTLSATGVRDATNGDYLAPAEVGTELANRLVPYFITSGANFAYGVGLISTNGLTLTRDPFEMRWNGTTYSQALLSLTGTSTVIISPEAVDLSASSVALTNVLSRGFVAL
jgi:hypothetical protein